MKPRSELFFFLSPFHACGLSDPLTHPKVVHDLHSLLELYGNVHGNVVVETRANGELLRHRRPVVLTSWVNQKKRNWLTQPHRPPGSDRQSGRGLRIGGAKASNAG